MTALRTLPDIAVGVGASPSFGACINSVYSTVSLIVNHPSLNFATPSTRLNMGRAVRSRFGRARNFEPRTDNQAKSMKRLVYTSTKLQSPDPQSPQASNIQLDALPPPPLSNFLKCSLVAAEMTHWTGNGSLCLVIIVTDWCTFLGVV